MSQNHKAWNALGICLFKIGEYESAGTCFEKALSLYPQNATYQKNYDKNQIKRETVEEFLELDDESAPEKKTDKPVVQTQQHYTIMQYTLGWLLSLLYFCS
jgi:tetratricopeptide (TPR) repeat protein